MTQSMHTAESGLQSLEYLRIDSSVLMKIVKHEKDGLKPNGCGQLLGNFEKGYVEATDCYPLLNNNEMLSDVGSVEASRESQNTRVWLKPTTPNSTLGPPKWVGISSHGMHHT